jgi:hypothetical protein
LISAIAAGNRRAMHVLFAAIGQSLAAANDVYGLKPNAQAIF